MKKFYIPILIIIVLIIVYALGPGEDDLVIDKSLPELNLKLSEIDDFVKQKETQFKLREDNQARIIWADSTRKTKYVFLYIHGFSASQGEGLPVHQNVAQHYKANLFLCRLSGHGYRENSLSDYTATSGWEAAKEALVIASNLGDSIILMGTSTGCTYALMLAAHFPEKVHSIINYSANIRVNSGVAFLLNNPWGTEIAETIIGKNRKIEFDSILHAKYWDTLYTIDALVELQNLLETQMTPETFKKVSVPCLNLYYYKDDNNQDNVVRVDKIKWMHELLGTPEAKKRSIALPGPENHVLASPIKSKDIQSVQRETIHFCDEVLHLSSI